MRRGEFPHRPRQVLAYGGAILTVLALVWVAATALMHIWLVTVTVAVALLVAALLEPVASHLRRLSMPATLAALLCLLLLLAVPAGAGFLLVSRATAQLGNVGEALATAVERLRDWLVHGPPGLSPQQVDGVRNEAVQRLRDALPTVTAGATTVAQTVGAAILVVFVVFFLLKDGDSMWRWAVGQVPRHHRSRWDTAGHAAWHTLTRYVAVTVVIALIDAVAIGLGLVVIGIPLVLPLTLLIFLGAFIPLLGATLSGAVAVLVALVTEGVTPALLVFAVVLLVQQLEGNVLQPLLMGHAVALHPVAIVLAVTVGGLLLGVAGAIVAVPTLAVAYAVLQSLRRDDDAPGGGTGEPTS